MQGVVERSSGVQDGQVTMLKQKVQPHDWESDTGQLLCMRLCTPIPMSNYLLSFTTSRN
jgi:hypothetical protein